MAALAQLGALAVGSSAMPHKMNTRSSERINGLALIVCGYLSMAGELAGDHWNEGDVSFPVVRRVALPDAFFALDGLFKMLLTVLDEFGACPAPSSGQPAEQASDGGNVSSYNRPRSSGPT